MNHIVALSGGKDSTAMALRLAEIEPRAYTYVCTPTGRELPEMDAHWARLESLLDQSIVRLTNGTLDAWIRTWRALPNFRMRWCTRVLKIEPMMAYLRQHQPATHYVGLRVDEPMREGLYGAAAMVTDYPLRRWRWSQREVVAYNRSRGVTIPSRTDCDLCFFQRVSEWRALLRRYPDRYAEGEAYEALTGATFRTPGRDSWPVPLVSFRAAVERQRGFDFEDEASEACRACTL
jgi:Phosphoadenosine phosphosulfate reductase family